MVAAYHLYKVQTEHHRFSHIATLSSHAQSVALTASVVLTAPRYTAMAYNYIRLPHSKFSHNRKTPRNLDNDDY